MNLGTVVAIASGVLLLALVVWGARRLRGRAVEPSAPVPVPAIDRQEQAAPRLDDPLSGDDLALIREGFEESRRRAAELGLPALVLETYRNIRSGATSLAPGKLLPAILSAPEVIPGPPTTYRFGLKDEVYTIVRTGLPETRDEATGSARESLQVADAAGTILFEMELVTADYRAEEQPGAVNAVVEGAWIEDFRELNTSFSRDTKRISDDFRKKFRAKESERLKRDFGV